MFEEEDALDKFEGFASLNGPAFYRLPVNEDTINLHKSPFTVPDVIDCAGTSVVPFHAGETLNWSFSGV